MVSVGEVLVSVINLLQSPQNWTKGIDAKTKDGDKVQPTSREAFAWSLLGAIERCSFDLSGGVVPCSSQTVIFVRQCLPDWAKKSLTKYNDAPQTSHEDILDLLHKAIAKHESQRIKKIPSPEAK